METTKASRDLETKSMIALYGITVAMLIIIEHLKAGLDHKEIAVLLGSAFTGLLVGRQVRQIYILINKHNKKGEARTKTALGIIGKLKMLNV